MAYGLVITSGPATEPITRAQAKLFVRVDYTDEDDSFDLWISAGRDHCERIAGLSLITRTYKLTAQNWYELMDEYVRRLAAGLPVTPSDWNAVGNYPPRIRLPGPPAIAVTQIQYKATDGTLTTLSTSNYQLDAARQPAVLIPASGLWWPPVRFGVPDAVQITYTAGYGVLATSVPPAIRDMLLSYVAYRFRQREEPDPELLEKMFGRFRLDDWV